MKIALCISGQPRKAVETYPYIYENIIKPNNADVFLHIHFDNNNLYIEKSHLDNGTCLLEKDYDKTVINLYKPIKYIVEPPRNFTKNNYLITDKRLNNFKKMNSCKIISNENMKTHMIKQMMSMYYSIYKCNELKEIYSCENNFVYDYVIRLRFDFCPFEPLKCSLYNPLYINYLNLNQPDNLISDWINFGSNSVMNIYSSLFLNIEYLNTFNYYKKNERLPNNLEPSDICSGMNEHLLRDLMYLYKIPNNSFYLNSKLFV